jgi:hypothetical protein
MKKPLHSQFNMTNHILVCKINVKMKKIFSSELSNDGKWQQLVICMYCMCITINNIANFPLSRFCVTSPLKYSKGELYLCTVDPLDERPGLVAGPDCGLEEAVHVYVVHFYDAGRTIWWIPPCQKNNEKLTENKFGFYGFLKLCLLRPM